MRLMLYNVRYGAGIGRGFHFPVPGRGYLRSTGENLQRIIAFIRSWQPDIVGLVEVDSGSYRARRRNQAEAIASAVGHYHCYESKYGLASWARRLPLLNKQGNAFLTGREIQGEKFHYFEKGVKRLVIELELENLNIFLVHLSLKFRQRAHQLSDLYSLLQPVRKPVIVAGDFNAFHGERELHLFMKATGLESANREDLLTYPSWAPRRQLDFILHSPEIKITGFQVPQVTLSDHLPLVCDFHL